jgi:hypothetical protein
MNRTFGLSSTMKCYSKTCCNSHVSDDFVFVSDCVFPYSKVGRIRLNSEPEQIDLFHALKNLYGSKPSDFLKDVLTFWSMFDSV